MGKVGVKKMKKAAKHEKKGAKKVKMGKKINKVMEANAKAAKKLMQKKTSKKLKLHKSAKEVLAKTHLKNTMAKSYHASGFLPWHKTVYGHSKAAKQVRKEANQLKALRNSLATAQSQQDILNVKEKLLRD